MHSLQGLCIVALLCLQVVWCNKKIPPKKLFGRYCERGNENCDHNRGLECNAVKEVCHCEHAGHQWDASARDRGLIGVCVGGPGAVCGSGHDDHILICKSGLVCEADVCKSAEPAPEKR